MSDVVTLVQYFIDHLPSIITAGGAVYIGVIQHRNGRRAAETNVVAKQISYDLRNGVGEKIATKAAEHMAPALVEAASVAAAVAADKIVVKAEEVAAALATKNENQWNGEDRRTGAADTRVEKVEQRKSPV